MEKCSLQLAANSVRHVIASYEHRNQGHNSIIEQASYGLQVLEYVAKHEELVKAAMKLQKANPMLATLLKEFPDSEIVDIRKKTDSPNDS